MRRHYVYYRVPVDRLDAATQAATAMQSGLRERHPGLGTALLRRPEVKDGRVTLMEVYALAGADLDGPLAGAIEAWAAAAMAPWTDGARHVETFDLLAEG
jgi:hypothetical protein